MTCRAGHYRCSAELGDLYAARCFAGDARCAESIAAAQAAKVEAVWQIDGGGLDALARTGEGVSAGETGRRRGDRVDARDPRVHVGHDGSAERLHDQPRQT
jgi:hypothetical protein